MITNLVWKKNTEFFTKTALLQQVPNKILFKFRKLSKVQSKKEQPKKFWSANIPRATLPNRDELRPAPAFRISAKLVIESAKSSFVIN